MTWPKPSRGKDIKTCFIFAGHLLAYPLQLQMPCFKAVFPCFACNSTAPELCGFLSSSLASTPASSRRICRQLSTRSCYWSSVSVVEGPLKVLSARAMRSDCRGLQRGLLKKLSFNAVVPVSRNVTTEPGLSRSHCQRHDISLLVEFLSAPASQSKGRTDTWPPR